MKKWQIGVGITILVMSLSLGAYMVWHKPTQTAESAAAISQPTFTYSCTSTNDPGNLLCLEKAYQSYTKQNGVAAAFVKLKTAYNNDSTVKSYCHVLTHTIGRTAGDTLKTIDDAYAQGDNFCWSGYYHGVMESVVSRIGKTNLAAKIPTICAQVKAQKPYSFYHYNCVHGLGHGVMDVTSSQLFESLSMCDRLTDQWEQESCYGGVFMENVMDEINPDHHTNFFKSDQPMYPCTAVQDKYKGQCYLMQTSHALHQANENFSQVFGECRTVEPAYVDTCYQSLGRDASGNTSSTVGPTVANCMLGADIGAQQNCIVGAVKDFISYYHSDVQAGLLCKAVAIPLQHICQDTKVQYYSTF